MYTGTFIVVILLNQFVFFGFCLNPICLVAAMPHCLAITVVIGSWINAKRGWGQRKSDVSGKASHYSEKVLESATALEAFTAELEEKAKQLADERKRIRQLETPVNEPTQQRSVCIPPTPLFRDKLQSEGVESLWHITHRDNIPKILKHGLCPRDSVRVSDIKGALRDTSNPNTQFLYDKNDPIFHRRINGYVPLYLNPRNPMLYRKKELQSELCILEIDIDCVLTKDFLITDGNSGSNSTQFFKDALSASIPWSVLRADFWGDFDDGKRKRCAEVLIPDHVDSSYITKIHCGSDDTLFYLRATMGDIDSRFVSNETLFFGEAAEVIHEPRFHASSG